jgi:toxin ParE1/3/4
MNSAWRVRLGRQAEQDYVEILRWSTKTFGEAQARTYAQTISLAIKALKDGPEILGSKVRDEIEPSIRTLHVARLGRKGRHFVVFRSSGDRAIDVLRVLHDSMDLPRHLPAANDFPN